MTFRRRLIPIAALVVAIGASRLGLAIAKQVAEAHGGRI